jgi:hypothetical protein
VSQDEPEVPAYGVWAASSTVIQHGGGIVQQGMRVPSGQIHAVLRGASVTLCGLGVAQLQAFPALVFEHMNVDMRCEGCRTVYGERTTDTAG